MVDLGSRIRELRLSRKMSQEELGRRVGKSKSVISNYENNLKIPNPDILMQFATIFHVSLDNLAGLDKSETISLDGLEPEQKELLKLIASAFRNPSIKADGLSQLEQEIIGKLVNEFSKKR